MQLNSEHIYRTKNRKCYRHTKYREDKPALDWLFCLKHHREPHSDWWLQICGLIVPCKRNHKWRRACPIEISRTNECKYAYQNNILNNKSNGYINYIPRIVVDSKWATTWCCMSCCSKNTYVHTVSRQDGWWQSRLLSGGPPNTHKELWLLIPAPTFFFHWWLCTVEDLLCGRL